jgi:hypothetical protein
MFRGISTTDEARRVSVRAAQVAGVQDEKATKGKTPITAADLLNDRVLPFFEEHDVKLLRVLTDRGSEFCGNPERHEYELYLSNASRQG